MIAIVVNNNELLGRLEVSTGIRSPVESPLECSQVVVCSIAKFGCGIMVVEVRPLSGSEGLPHRRTVRSR